MLKRDNNGDRKATAVVIVGSWRSPAIWHLIISVQWRLSPGPFQCFFNIWFPFSAAMISAEQAMQSFWMWLMILQLYITVSALIKLSIYLYYTLLYTYIRSMRSPLSPSLKRWHELFDGLTRSPLMAVAPPRLLPRLPQWHHFIAPCRMIPRPLRWPYHGNGAILYDHAISSPPALLPFGVCCLGLAFYSCIQRYYRQHGWKLMCDDLTFVCLNNVMAGVIITLQILFHCLTCCGFSIPVPSCLFSVINRNYNISIIIIGRHQLLSAVLKTFCDDLHRCYALQCIWFIIYQYLPCLSSYITIISFIRY